LKPILAFYLITFAFTLVGFIAHAIALTRTPPQSPTHTPQPPQNHHAAALRQARRNLYEHTENCRACLEYSEAFDADPCPTGTELRAKLQALITDRHQEAYGHTNHAA